MKFFLKIQCETQQYTFQYIFRNCWQTKHTYLHETKNRSMHIDEQCSCTDSLHQLKLKQNYRHQPLLTELTIVRQHIDCEDPIIFVILKFPYRHTTQGRVRIV